MHCGMMLRKASRRGARGSSWACPGAREKPIARPEPSAITQALVPKPPRERPTASHSSRWSEDPPFGRSRGLLMRPNAGAVEKRHPQFDAALLLGQLQETLPDPHMTPAVEHLRTDPQ